MTDPWAVFAEFYDHIPLYRDRADAGFYLAQAKAAGGPVLELGCGTGRILAQTARAGIPVVGLDASPGMLGLCRRRLAQEGLRADLACGDMRRFAFGRAFTLVTIPFRPFQHLLEVEDQMACLASIREHLAPNGRLVFDVFNPDLKLLASDSAEPVLEFEFELPDGRKAARSFRQLAHHRDRQVKDLEFLFEVRRPDGSREDFRATISMRYFFRYELEHLLARCGFHVEHLYGDFDGRAEGGELIFVAGKA